MIPVIINIITNNGLDYAQNIVHRQLWSIGYL